MRYAPVIIMNNETLPPTGTANSTGVDLNQIALASIQAEWTGNTATGTLELQISNDDVPVAAGNNNPVGLDPAANVVNWSTYTGSVTTVSGPGNFMWNLVFVGYRWIRVLYTAGSGTGTISATAVIKG